MENRSGGQGRITYFCIRFYKILQENIYNIILKRRDSNGIIWLHTRMPYHR